MVTRRREAQAALAAALAGALSLACDPAHRRAGSGRPWPEPGHVLHVVFLHGRPPPLGESRSEGWLLIGDDRTIVQSRHRTYDAAGDLEMESFAVTARHKAWHVSHRPTPHRFENQTGPRVGEPVMWTEAAIQDRLLARGFRITRRVTIASRSGAAYERRDPPTPGASGIPTDHEQAALPVAPSALRAFVQRVYVGDDPFGLDLGEETGYEDHQGKLHPIYYRTLILHEQLPPSVVPPDAFDWPHGTD